MSELRAAHQVLGKNHVPVILVTSKYHTRRARLTWHQIAGDDSEVVVRAAKDDPFDPNTWWSEPRSILSVVREYLGLLNYYAVFPVTPVTR